VPGVAITRQAAVQSWPALKNDDTLRLATTASTLASSSTTTGALPPSSRCTRASVSAAARAIALPVPTEPVSDTIRIAGWVTSDVPTGSPWPVTTLNTPAGRTSSASSARRIVVSGVSSDGLSTIALPAASAGAIFQIAIASG